MEICHSDILRKANKKNVHQEIRVPKNCHSSEIKAWRTRIINNWEKKILKASFMQIV